MRALAGVDPRWLLYGAGIAGIVYVAWRLSGAAPALAASASAAVRSAVDAVNPASSSNIINRGVSAAGSAVTGDASWSLGGQIAEWFSPSVRAANASLRPDPLAAEVERIRREWYGTTALRTDAADFAVLDTVGYTGGYTGAW